MKHIIPTRALRIAFAALLLLGATVSFANPVSAVENDIVEFTGYLNFQGGSGSTVAGYYFIYTVNNGAAQQTPQQSTTVSGSVTVTATASIPCGSNFQYQFVFWDQSAGGSPQYGSIRSGSTNACTPPPQQCNPSSVANGTVAPYPSCQISCFSGYQLSGTQCVPVSTPVPTVTLSASPTNVNQGGSSVLTWSTSPAASYCVASGPGNWYGNRSASGSEVVYPAMSSQVYSITCYNSQNQAGNTATVAVTMSQNQCNPSSVANGYVTAYPSCQIVCNSGYQVSGNTCIPVIVQQCNPSFVANGYVAAWPSCQITCFSGYYLSGNQCLITNTQQLSVVTQPATNIGQNFATLNGFVSSSNASVNTWFEYGTTYSLGLNTSSRFYGFGSTNFSDTASTLAPNTTYYYRAVAQGSGGYGSNLVYGTILSFTTGQGTGCSGYGCSTTAPDAVTTLPTNIGPTSARLNGLALIYGSVPSQGYFEWGSTPSLGNTTASQSLGSQPSVAFNQSIFNLVDGQTYYYRAVVTNQYGTDRGDIVSFRARTSVTTTVTNTVVTNTNVVRTAVSKPSLVALAIDRNNEGVCHANEIEYTVTWKNISQRQLRDVLLRVILPREFVHLGNTQGAYSETDHTVVVQLGGLAPGQEGFMRVRVRVSPDAEINKRVVTTADLVYTNAVTGDQEEVIAYSINSICSATNLSVNNQGAFAFFGGAFLPDTLLEWLLLFLIIFAIVVLARRYYGERSLNP